MKVSYWGSNYTLDKKYKILIIEDEAIFVMSLERALKKSGFDVCESVLFGEEAFERVNQENPDLVIIDLCLNEDISGVKVANQIRSSSDIPIVFMSGFQKKEIERQIEKFDRCFYLTKPFNPEDLIRAIKMFLM